jgi:hypothetical protein
MRESDRKDGDLVKNEGSPKERAAWLRLVATTLLALSALCPGQVMAQVPGRFYWKTLSGGNAVPLIVNSLSGNTNPFDPSHRVNPGANVSATLALAGYARTYTLLGRSAMTAVLVPMGRVSGEVTAAGRTSNEASAGFGDPMIEFDLNLLGPRAQKNLPDALRYEPGFSVDFLADLAVPVGEYNNEQPLNLGQNRWYGRLGLPVVWQLGPWVPGRRTTLEFLPAVWVFGPNDDFVGQTMTTDPMFQVDAHLTRDLTERFWVGLDASWYTGGQATVNGTTGEKLNNLGFGPTLGYQINESLGLTFGYKSTVNDKAPEDLRMDGFMVSVLYGWHPLIEGVRRLGGEK